MIIFSARIVRIPGTLPYSSRMCWTGRAVFSRSCRLLRSFSSLMNGFSSSGPRLSCSTRLSCLSSSLETVLPVAIGRGSLLFVKCWLAVVMV